MQLYQTLLRNHPLIRDELLRLFRDACADHARQHRRYSLEHFGEELVDELFLVCRERGIATDTGDGKAVPA